MDTSERAHGGARGGDGSGSDGRDVYRARLSAEGVRFALDLLLALMGWLAADKLVLFVDDDDVRTREGRLDRKTACLNEFDM